MELFIFVAFLAVEAVLVSGQLVTNTSGDSGELCGKYHHCLTNSTCLRTKGDYSCVCPAPMKGNAKLGCVLDDSATVFVQADPHLKNLYNQFVSVSTPCRYRVMEFFTTETHLARIYLDNYLYHGGVYYTNIIEARIAVLDESSTGEDNRKWLSVLIEGDTTSEGHYQFKEWRKTNSSDWMTPSEQTQFMADGSEVITEYDHVNNLAIIEVAAIGLRMWFRPVDKFALERNPECVPQVPGVVMTVDKGKSASTQFSAVDLSSTPGGPDLRQFATGLGMSINMYAIFLTLYSSPLDEIDSHCPACDKANIEFKRLCSATDMSKSINVCGHLYHNQTFLACIAKQNLNETFLPHIFNDCLYATCGNSKTDCQALKAHIKRVGCKEPEPLQQLDCGVLGDGVTVMRKGAAPVVYKEVHDHKTFDHM
ncbi:hypothetical protein ElyMa_006606500 [Elysia marginata]|uniref:EGF-like domain-containing protein n=1 Tax=Elysia marginata TaxID=1093978 RepID=A0AAV4IG26_9GAST|nr:hypothetical protein ElyMa_006606500 [Elysia marginata]